MQRRVLVPVALGIVLGCGVSLSDPGPMAGQFPAPGCAAFAAPLPGSGTYDYAACDPQGSLLLLGRLTLAVAPDGQVSGTWQIDWAPGADRDTEVGPQVGSGELAGSADAGGLRLDLNPGWADHNVFLTATAGVSGGGWEWSTFTGPTAGGPFTTRRR